MTGGPSHGREIRSDALAKDPGSRGAAPVVKRPSADMANSGPDLTTPRVRHCDRTRKRKLDACSEFNA